MYDRSFQGDVRFKTTGGKAAFNQTAVCGSLFTVIGHFEI